MTCKGFVQLLLKVLNFLFILVGLAMIGYGIYMVVIWINSSSFSSSSSSSPPPPDSYMLYWESPALTSVDLPPKSFEVGGAGVLQLRRALLEAPGYELMSLSSFWTGISTAWFLYVFIIVGAVIVLITCSGYIAAATANGCCLSCYSVFIGLFMILELALAAFMFLNESWEEVIPTDYTGQLENIEEFVENNVYILKWVALGVIVVQALALLLAIILRTLGSRPAKDYDSDDEYVAPRTSRQPLVNRQAPATLGTGAAGSDNRPVRTDAWSTRMREKYGLDTTEFSYKPVDSKKFSQPNAPTEEKKTWCTIM